MLEPIKWPILSVFLTLGLVCLLMTDWLRRFLVNRMIAHEGTLRRIPIFGFFIRGFIFWFEAGSGEKLIQSVGVLCLLLGLVIAMLW